MKKILKVLIFVLFTSLLSAQVIAPQTRDLTMGDTIGIKATASDSEEDTTGAQVKPSQNTVIIPAAAHDPGITILEIDQEETGIEGEEIGVLANKDAGAEPVHMPIKGDTQDSPEADVEVAVGFGDGIKGRIPEAVDDPDDEGSGGVIIKGKSIKENYPDKDHDDWIEILSGTVESEKDLELFAVATAASDNNIEEISFYFNKIEMKYSQPAKLFGFIPVTYTATAIVGEEIYPDKYGRVKLKLPWWLAFAQDNSEELKGDLEQGMSAMGNNAQLANIHLQNAMQKQQQLIQMMSNVMKTKHDTAKAAVNNVR